MLSSAFMQSWQSKLRRPLNAALAAGSVLYPGLVYIGQSRVSPLTFIAFVLALIGLRLAISDRDAFSLWRMPIIMTAVGVVAISFLDSALAVKAYPVLINFGLAALFGYSLLRPPSLVERIARLREPDLPDDAAAYCWRVTLVWAAFGVFNGSIAWGTAVWGTLEMWTLWTGLIAYILMGVLFAGELMVRSVVLRRRA